ncbi:MAG TPA: Hsp33 family molecular chaperone HslO [Chiayiivirga sp.]|nr:Hsp33 family molecular chaperone HslO [Chiayiivirga sp.]
MSQRHPDVLHRFLIEGTPVRGVLVRLDESWNAIRARSDYPPAAAKLLGEAMAAVALFGGHTKVEGRLSLHLKGSQNLRTVFAEYGYPGVLRGLAHWQDPIPTSLSPRQFGTDAVLAITVETEVPGQDEPVRYQGLVDLDAPTLAQACERYFSQSEQLPTRLILVEQGTQVAGLLLQVMPGADPDDALWIELGALLDTLSAQELVELPAETLLYRLFHERGVRLLAEQSLAFDCTCSRERVAQMLRGLGEDEATAALQDGHASVVCEFCGQTYRFDAIDIRTLFSAPMPEHDTRQ